MTSAKGLSIQYDSYKLVCRHNDLCRDVARYVFICMKWSRVSLNNSDSDEDRSSKIAFPGGTWEQKIKQEIKILG